MAGYGDGKLTSLPLSQGLLRRYERPTAPPPVAVANGADIGLDTSTILKYLVLEGYSVVVRLPVQEEAEEYTVPEQKNAPPEQENMEG